MNLNGIFEITDWQETTDNSLIKGEQLKLAKVTQRYSGDLSGSSEVRYQMFYLDNGQAHFNGFEIFEGQIRGQDCYLTIQHQGLFENGIAKGDFRVVTSNTIKDLQGKTGSFISMENRKAKYQIES